MYSLCYWKDLVATIVSYVFVWWLIPISVYQSELSEFSFLFLTMVLVQAFYYFTAVHGFISLMGFLKVKPYLEKTGNERLLN